MESFLFTNDVNAIPQSQWEKVVIT